MSILKKNADGTYEAKGYSNIGDVIAEAREIAVRENLIVTFEFNGAIVNISSTSDLALIKRDFRRAMAGYLGRNAVVGPDPKPTLSNKELASDVAAELASQIRRTVDASRHSSDTTSVGDLPEMEFAGKNGQTLWQKYVKTNTDPLGASTMRYAERWARMMQLEMSRGKSLAEIYEATRIRADLERSMSGSTGSAAEQILIKTWEYGPELARMTGR